jgi:nucleoside-diphosphate-sugar epimerase
MKVAVIGATGHIGTWLVPMLIEQGHEVIAISRGLRQPYHVFDGWNDARHIAIDRSMAERDGTFGHSIAALRADAVIDLICFNVDSARHIVNALNGLVDHFIHCGTLWVHGVPQTRPYDETAPREPFGDYGIKKAAIEKYLLDEARSGFPATVLHPGHITGPGWMPINPAGNLDPAVFDRLKRGEPVDLPDDGLATLQHVHARDVATAFALAIGSRASIGESFHVAAREPVTLRDYATAAAGWFDRPPNLRFKPWDEWKKSVSDRDAELTFDHIAHSPCASIAKAERVLGFSPEFTAPGAVRDSLLE